MDIYSIYIYIYTYIAPFYLCIALKAFSKQAFSLSHTFLYITHSNRCTARNGFISFQRILRGSIHLLMGRLPTHHLTRWSHAGVTLYAFVLHMMHKGNHFQLQERSILLVTFEGSETKLQTI